MISSEGTKKPCDWWQATCLLHHQQYHQHSKPELSNAHNIDYGKYRYGDSTYVDELAKTSPATK